MGLFGQGVLHTTGGTWSTLPPPSSIRSITTMTMSTGASHMILGIAFEVLILERSLTGYSFGCCVT